MSDKKEEEEKKETTGVDVQIPVISDEGDADATRPYAAHPGPLKKDQ